LVFSPSLSGHSGHSLGWLQKLAPDKLETAGSRVAAARGQRARVALSACGAGRGGQRRGVWLGEAATWAGPGCGAHLKVMQGSDEWAEPEKLLNFKFDF
jgi:hypothetical protein